MFSFPQLKQNEKIEIEKLLKYFSIYNITNEIKNKTLEIRKTYSIKLPDSIICATAMVNNLTLVTNDKQLDKIDNLQIITLEELVKNR